MSIKFNAMLLLAALLSCSLSAQPYERLHPDEEESLLYYLPNGEHTFNPDVPTPYKVMGFNLSQRFIDWGDVTRYMETLDAASDKVSITRFGKTYLGRTFFQVCISSPENIRNLENIRQKHLDSFTGKDKSDSDPVIVNLMGSIHGNEATGVASAVIQAYFFAACTDPAVQKMLESTVVVITPGQNPDGLSRFSAWVNNAASANITCSPLQRESNEVWPSSRSNHYFADCNRDWLSVQHPEGQNCVAMYRYWMPDVVLDMHEQGSSTKGFYFSPGDPDRTWKDIPQKNQDLLQAIADSTAAALDEKGSFYFSREGYDDYFIGKGAAYGDVQGSVCILHEQTASYGHARNSAWTTLLFPVTLRNQCVAGISVAKSAYRLKDELKDYQREFYEGQTKAYRKDPVKGIAFSAGKDHGREARFADILLTHGIEFYKDASKDDSYVIPMEQDKYFVIKALFDNVTEFTDSVFYDISTWTFPAAFNLKTENLSTVKGRLGDKVTSPLMFKGSVKGGASKMAYLIPPYDFYSNSVIARLLDKGLSVRVAKGPFSCLDGDKETEYPAGTAIVPVVSQPLGEDALYSLMSEVADESGIDIVSLKSARMKEHDLGSGNFLMARKPRVAVMACRGLGVADTGEAWLLSDRRMGFDHALIDCQKISANADLSSFNVMVIAGGAPTDSLPKSFYSKIGSWVKAGGTLIVSKGGSAVARKAGLCDIKPVIAEGVTGVILNTTVKGNGPLFWGVEEGNLPVFKMNATAYKTKDGKVQLRYSDSPYISGYISDANKKAIAGTPAIITQTAGKGKVIFFANDFNFRSYWYGSSRVFSNAILYGNLIP